MKRIITIVLCFIGLTAISQIPPPVGYYPFTGNADDYSGNGFDGTVNGAVLNADRYMHSDKAYKFDGTNDHIVLPNDISLKPDFPFSISLWIKVDALNPLATSVLYCSDEGGSYNGFYIGCNPSGMITAGYGDGGGTSSTNRVTKHSNNAIDTSSWHNVVAVFNGLNNIDLYIDCSLDPGYYSGTGSSMNTTSSTGIIGRSLGHSPNSYFNGKLDDIRLFNQAIDLNAITALCNEDPYVGVEELNTTDITILPNPASDYVLIDMGKTNYGNKVVKVFDPLGRIVYSNSVESSKFSIDVSGWNSNSIYFLNVFDSNQKLMTTEKLIVE